MDMKLVEQMQSGTPDALVAPNQGDPLAFLTPEAFAAEPRGNECFQTVLSRQSESRYYAFLDDRNEVLKQTHFLDPEMGQIVDRKLYAAAFYSSASPRHFWGRRT